MNKAHYIKLCLTTAFVAYFYAVVLMIRLLLMFEKYINSKANKEGL